MKDVLKAIFIIVLIIFIVWTILSGAGSMLFLIVFGAYVFVMKHGR